MSELGQQSPFSRPGVMSALAPVLEVMNDKIALHSLLEFDCTNLRRGFERPIELARPAPSLLVSLP